MGQFKTGEVASYFKRFGLDASPEEISAFTGLDYIGGENAIADYVLAKKNMAAQQANDPLNKVLQAEQTFGSAQQAAAEGYGKEADSLYAQLQDIMGQAPKLFGNLTPDQVDQYLAPLKTTFNQADALTQTGNAARGLAGSSIEAQARSDAGNRFKENVLQTGLNVGMTQQQAQEQAVQNEINRKSGLMVGSNANALNAFGLQNQSAGQISGNQRADALLLSSLPGYLRAQNMQNLIASQAYNKSRGGGLMQTMGDINAGINLFMNFTSIPGSFVSSFSGGGAGAGSLDTGAPPFPQGSMSGTSPISYPAAGGSLPYRSAGGTNLAASLSLL
jgi:hypothetical protein